MVATAPPARVVVIDYGMGNLGSVSNALHYLSIEARVEGDPEAIGDATHLILPGVGAFGDGMEGLRQKGWVDALRTAVGSGGIPLLGICLGMQLLAEVGTEHGEHEGLGWIPGRVERLAGSPEARIPHIGWNDVEASPRSRLLAGMPATTAFYFVHSYAFRPRDPELATGTTDHGEPFVSVVERDNVFGVQFHPEKSHRAGLQLLANFVDVRVASAC